MPNSPILLTLYRYLLFVSAVTYSPLSPLSGHHQSQTSITWAGLKYDVIYPTELIDSTVAANVYLV